MASFTLATTEKYKDKETTEWHRCTVWGALADVVDKYVRKGDKLAIIGRIRYREYEDRDGNKRWSTNINVDELVMLGSPSGDSRRERDAEDPEDFPDDPDAGGAPPDDADEPPSRPRGGATEDDVPPKARPSGLPARKPRSAPARPARGSSKAGPVKSRKPRGR